MAQYDINKIQLPNGDICNIKGDISDCYTKSEADESFVGCQTRVDDVQVANNPLRVPVEDISSLYTINKTSGNANPVSVSAYRVGQMIQMQINLAYTASTNAGSDIFNGSLTGGPLPVTNMTVCSGYQGACTATLNIYSNGGIVIRASGSGSIGSNGSNGAYRIVFLTSDESSIGSIVEEETIIKNTNISNFYSITKTSGNATVTSINAIRSGNYVQFDIYVRFSAAVAAGSNAFVGVLTGGPLPVLPITTAVSYHSSSAALIELKTNGEFTIRIIGGSHGGSNTTHAWRFGFICSDE